MKETVNVSIASQAFTIDEDAWQMLDNYLKSIRDRLEPDDSETLADIETRIADLFRENLPSPVMVVSAALARRVMEQIGSPEIFGNPRKGTETAEEAANNNTNNLNGGTKHQGPMMRSQDDRILAGLCGGIARHFGCESSVVRLIALILIIFGGMSVWIYIILWLIIPAEPKNTML